MTLFYALLTITTLGSWIAIAQTIPFRNQQIRIFYISLANLVLALVVALFQEGPLLREGAILMPFLGGLVWAVSCYFALLGADNIGLAKAQGIWAPLNILVSILWGILLFGEFSAMASGMILLSMTAVMAIIAGILLILFAGDSKATTDSGLEKNSRIGIIGALMAGLFWGSYFIPIRLSEVSLWTTAFPMAMGIFAGSTALFLYTRESLLLNRRSHYSRVLLSGVLWGIGNYGSLRLMELVGTGKGFTIAQAAIVLAAMYSVILFNNPPLRSKGALLTLSGIALSLGGSIILGNM